MPRPIISIHDMVTDETVVREMNDTEFAQFEAEQAARVLQEQAEATEAAKKAALLKRLGLTADEAVLLLS